MPHSQFRIVAGVDQNETPTLNQAGVSQSQLIRFFYDRNGVGLVQKLGGWTAYYGAPIITVVRALWAWADQNLLNHLAVGTQNLNGATQLSVITNGAQQVITPQYVVDNIAPVVSTTSGSATATITDATTMGITQYDAVFIETHISIGGLILFGLYPTVNPSASATTYEITAVDTLGNPLPASGSSSSPTVASFTTANGLNTVTVTLANHGYVVGSTYPVLVSTTVGGVTLYGNYVVQSVTSTSVFVINAAQVASSTATASINAGNARYLYSFGIGGEPVGSGYGVNGYGTGGYGSGTTISPSLGTAIPATDWTMDNFGQILVSCPVNGTLFQPVYLWDPTSGAQIATCIATGPTINDGVFVAMPQRQIIAWGSSFTGIQDPLLIRWCDVNNPLQWIGQVINQAGSFRIPRGSKIVGALQMAQQGLIWTDIAVWSMQYINQPLIYSFNEIAAGCGLIGRKAAGVIGGTVYWMSQSQFFTISAEGVQIVPCPVWDVVFQQIDISNASKIRTAVNSRFNEIAWYYPTLTSGGEVAAYVKLNNSTTPPSWDFGMLSRSAWVDQSILGPPIGADPSSLLIYQHETSPDAGGQPMLSSFETGYMALSDADVKMFVDQVWPDMKWGPYAGNQNATVMLTFYVADYPSGPVTTYGPYALTDSTDYIRPRFRGRLVSIGISSSDTGSFWRTGGMRYESIPDGRY